MLSEDLFINSDDNSESTPERHQKEFDCLAGLMVKRFKELLGNNDILEVKFYFITYCRKYVRTTENG